MGLSAWGFFAIIFGLIAFVLVVLAIAVFYGYIDTSLVGNLTADELGVFGVLAIGGAVGCEVAGRRNH